MHCGHDVGAPDATRCPSCGQSLAIRASSSPEKPAPRSRLKSTAGPSIPVPRRTDDSVPEGSNWMQRLEHARQVGILSAVPEAQAELIDASPPGGSGPRDGKKNGNGHDAAFQAKPAHLLIAELDAIDEESKPKIEARNETAGLSIADVEIETPKVQAVPRRKIPKWVTGSVVAVVTVAAVGVRIGTSEPPPEPAREIDPALVKKLETRKKAMASLEKGHELALKGPGFADAAIAAYKEALALEPTLPGAERGLGSAYYVKKDVKRAVEHYKRYLMLSPDADDAEEVRAIVDRHEDDPMRPKKARSVKRKKRSKRGKRSGRRR